MERHNPNQLNGTVKILMLMVRDIPHHYTFKKKKTTTFINILLKKNNNLVINKIMPLTYASI